MLEVDYFLSSVLWIISDDSHLVVRTEGITGGVLRKDLLGFSVFLWNAPIRFVNERMNP